jgi:hypothetical protein
VKFAPTDEQLAVADACAAGRNVVVQAAAGAGKTTTMKLAAGRMRGTGWYGTYNSIAAKDAKKSMPASVKCSTIHSLAWPLARPYQQRGRLVGVPDGAKRQTGAQVAEILGITNPIMCDGVLVPPRTIGRLAAATVDQWCLGIDYKPEAKHVPTVKGLSEAGQRYLAEQIVPWSHKAWLDIFDVDGRLNVKHDHYLRMWWNTGKARINADFVILDEAQDANALAAAIIQSQKHAQLVAVGDSCQALYGWRGAVDALKRWPADITLYLRQSFRFGDAVAEQANHWLRILDADLRVIGTPGIQSQVADAIDLPEAVLCRTNAGAMAAVLEALELGRKPALANGGGEVREFAEAALALQEGYATGHRDLWAFSSWQQVLDYLEAEEEEAGDLYMLVNLVEQYGAQKLIDVIDHGLSSPARADVTMSTVHGSKGLEWPSVQIGGDFTDPGYDRAGRLVPVPRALGMVAYVAVTRPKLLLGRGSLSWVDQRVAAMAA